MSSSPTSADVASLTLRMVGVAVAYESATVLNAVTGVVRAGDSLALVGPNGAGKTTLIRGILGLAPVDSHDLIVTGVAALTVGGAVLLLHKELVFSAFDPEGAEVRGYRVELLDLIVLVAVAVVVVVAIPAVGTLLAVALLTVPAMTARLWVERIVPAMVVASVIGALSGVIGLCVSAMWKVAAGGAIALTCSAFFGASLAIVLFWFAIDGKWRVLIVFVPLPATKEALVTPDSPTPTSQTLQDDCEMACLLRSLLLKSC